MTESSCWLNLPRAQEWNTCIFFFNFTNNLIFIHSQSTFWWVMIKTWYFQKQSKWNEYMFACIYFQIKYHAMHVFLILLFLSKKGLLMCIRLVFVCYLSAILQKWTLRFDRLMAWNSNSKYLPHYHKMAIKVFAANTLIKMLTLISYIFFLTDNCGQLFTAYR